MRVLVIGLSAQGGLCHDLTTGCLGAGIFLRWMLDLRTYSILDTVLVCPWAGL